MLGHWEIILIILAVIVLFGSKKIPEFMRGLGSGVSEFKKGLKEGSEKKSEDKKPEEDDNK